MNQTKPKFKMSPLYFLFKFFKNLMYWAPLITTESELIHEGKC